MLQICKREKWQRVGGVRGYNTPGDRQRAVTQLRKHGFNHFVFFKEVRSEYALQYGRAAWVEPGTIYICR